MRLRLAPYAGLVLTLAALAACSRGRSSDGVATVSVGTLAGFAPIVVFHRPDGSAAQVVVPGADGKASATIEPGSQVTVGWSWVGYTDQWRLTTITSVQPGDLLDVDPDPFVVHTTFRTIATTLPGVANGAIGYDVDAGCATASGIDPASALDLFVDSPPCGATVDVLGTASGPSGPVAWSAALDVALADTAVALGPWQDLDAVTVVATNAPAGAYLAYATLEPRRNGLRYSQTQSGDAHGIAPGGSAVLSLPYAPGFASSARRVVRLHCSSDGGVTEDGVAYHVVNEAPLASETLDLPTALPPRIQGAQVTTSNGARTARWTQTAEDGALDAQIVFAGWRAVDGDHEWHVVLPPGARSFAFPPLPAELSAHAPAAGSAIAFAVGSYDLSDASGYADFKRAHLALARYPLANSLSDVLPERGSWTLRAFVSGPR